MPSPFSSLPADALRHILTFLGPADIQRLHVAFPPASGLREYTHDPHLWYKLYRRDFRPPPPPLLRLTPAGRMDWCAAYVEADRRRQCVRRQRDMGWGFAEQRRQRMHRPGVARFAWSARLGGGELVRGEAVAGETAWQQVTRTDGRTEHHAF